MTKVYQIIFVVMILHSFAFANKHRNTRTPYIKSAITKIWLEADSLHGRSAVKINLRKKARSVSKIQTFLEKNGFVKSESRKLLSRLYAHNKFYARVEKFGCLREQPFQKPEIGQSHEIEFGDLRCNFGDGQLVSHAWEFYSSPQLQNGVTALKVVGETLGEQLPDATTEIILGPSSNKQEYQAALKRVLQFQKRVKNHEGKISIGKAIAAPEDTDGQIWYDPEGDDGIPCIHTTRGVPIRAMSEVLALPESHMTPQAKLLLDFSGKETDLLVAHFALPAVRGKKLWETLNLAIWMAAVEGVVHTLMPFEHPLDSSNETLVRWTKYAGKNFIGVVSRFTAGDLLRSGGLQIRDRQIVSDLLVSEDAEKNQQHFDRFVLAALNSVRHFVVHLEKSDEDDLRKIAGLLRDRWSRPARSSVTYWITRDLQIDFLPRAGAMRYPADTDGSYGCLVNCAMASPSFAHSQFLPRREIVSSNGDAPVCGAFEFRASEHAGNDGVENLFMRGKKHERQYLGALWNDFANYRERVAKKPRREK